jgi:hypothetical protein
MLCKPDPASVTQDERNKGKAGELACGFGGSVGAWRRIAHSDTRSDAEILADIHAWRQAHPKTTAFWHNLTRAIRIAIRTGQPFSAGKIVAEFTDGNLTLTLPSNRRLTYPEARLVLSKFEGGYPDVLFKDNAYGKWTDYRGWFGTFAENVVQGTARDLLAAVLERFEARGIPIPVAARPNRARCQLVRSRFARELVDARARSARARLRPRSRSAPASSAARRGNRRARIVCQVASPGLHILLRSAVSAFT